MKNAQKKQKRKILPSPKNFHKKKSLGGEVFH
jgi:hypothetical protein